MIYPRLLAIPVFLAALTWATLASAWLIGKPAAIAYTGPGDIASFTAWWGLRAYSAAVAATGTQPALDLRRTSDNATCTALIGTAGDLDLAVGTPCNGASQTVTAWATRGTFTNAAISGTSLTFTSLSGSASSGDEIIGTGITATTTIVGACTVSPCTITPSQTVASTTIIDLIPLRVSKGYDQTAGNACGAASCDLVQATAGNQPRLFFLGGGGSGTLPYIQCGPSQGSCTLQSANNFTPSGTFMSLSVVALKVDTVGAGTLLICANENTNCVATDTGPNRWTCNASVSNTANLWHAGNCAKEHSVGNGVTFNVDGTEVTNTGTITASTSKPKIIYPVSTGVTFKYGEGGFKDGTKWDGTVRTNLCHSQRLYWDTGGSC